MPPPNETEADVRAVIHAFLRTGALPGPEAVAVSLAHLAAGFTGIGTGPGDYYADRAAFGDLLRREKAQGPYPSGFELLAMHVRELRRGLALAEGQIRFGIELGGETHVVEPRCSFVLAHGAGRWLIVHFHFSVANAMQREGDSLIDALQNRNRQLEEEVARRTAEIERALADLRAVQARLAQQEKLAGLGRLTAGIAHEIKNPLNFVTNFAALTAELATEVSTVLAGPAPNAAEARALLADLRANAGKVVEHGQRADAIVRAMMQHARGGVEPARPVGVNALVEAYVRLALDARPDGEGAVEVVCDLDPAAGEVEGAPQELGRVVVNLVANALDAVAERARAGGARPYAPHVGVRTERAGGHVRIVVADNGVGLPAGSAGLLFEPFYTTKPTGRGNIGLGLSLSRDVVVAHGGEIGAAAADGPGAVFTVTLAAV